MGFRTFLYDKIGKNDVKEVEVEKRNDPPSSCLRFTFIAKVKPPTVSIKLCNPSRRRDDDGNNLFRLRPYLVKNPTLMNVHEAEEELQRDRRQRPRRRARLTPERTSIIRLLDPHRLFATHRSLEVATVDLFTKQQQALRRGFRPWHDHDHSNH